MEWNKMKREKEKYTQNKNRNGCVIHIPVSCVTSNSFAIRYWFFVVPLAKNNEPRSACVSRPTFTSILWQSTSISSSLEISRISSINSSVSSKFSKYCRLLSESREHDVRFCFVLFFVLLLFSSHVNENVKRKRAIGRSRFTSFYCR